ncbi:DUF2147 domain-containing protein [Moraxella sp. FZLJ2107]|uniref:DUF2147 domain-containing protein n=1 Tax=unclassified Moraxella TaxID=2685852 RepID=UPI00209BD517|nr:MULTISPECIES: DUF2147 domain-containing protein [unclassified Moraxella]USZ14255.1 DUF2147 domain-containing protein [Moraxella sp. FZFQ2102]UTO04926.1 DUF2147 domain-containing protein [Moraxella sp. FZLJ2107]UTO21660.1 DUF2147 domain-containing protein [Moraxella sp. FZLJ2109]
MKFSSKLMAIGAGLALSASAFAADGIVGHWQTYEDGQPKAVVQISQSGNTFTGKIVEGNTAKAKTYVGRTVITGLKADGGGKYSGGKITDPVNGKTYDLNATLKGSKLDLKGGYKIAGKVVGRSQTWQKK